MLRSLKEAFKMFDEQDTIFREYSSTFPKDIVAKWQREFDEWCAAPDPNNSPFELSEKRACHPLRTSQCY